MGTVSAIAMAIWLSAGLFHPVMQAHPQPNSELTDGLSHDRILLASHVFCPFCFGVLALPADESPQDVIRTLQFEQPVPLVSTPASIRNRSPFSNRAPPYSNG